jgi:hypothetical protein
MNRSVYYESNAFRVPVRSDLEDLAFATRLLLATPGLRNLHVAACKNERNLVPVGVYRGPKKEDVFAVYAIVSLRDTCDPPMEGDEPTSRPDRDEDDHSRPIEDLVMVRVSRSEIKTGIPTWDNRPFICLCPDCLTPHE